MSSNKTILFKKDSNSPLQISDGFQLFLTKEECVDLMMQVSKSIEFSKSNDIEKLNAYIVDNKFKKGFKIEEAILKYKTETVQTKLIDVPAKKRPSKTIFENSKYNDFEEVKNYFLNKPEYVKKYFGADLKYYIDSVLTWSDKDGKKTTDRGWIAYIRQFMNSDIEKNKLVLKQKEERRKEVIPEQARKEGNHVNF